MSNNIVLPGLIDIHTHLRTPGQTQKEDFLTGTSAAVAGGFTTIIDMPNNTAPITSSYLLNEKIEIAKTQTITDIGFHFGSLGDNLDEFEKVKNKVFGLKLYLNQTTGGFIIGKKELVRIYDAWNSPQPILLHAEDDVLDMVFEIVKKTKKPTHICHVSSRDELLKIAKAKEKGLPVTCGVTPHHLFLTKEDAKRLGAFGRMKPFLKGKRDTDFIWKNFAYVDIIESDHAPHTLQEKNADAPFGVPGLETTLPLLLTAAEEGKLSIDEIVQLCHTNPIKIFNIKLKEESFVDISMEKFTVQRKKLLTKCGWSPFEKRQLIGKVVNVTVGRKKVFENGKVLIRPGDGKVITP